MKSIDEVKSGSGSVPLFWCHYSRTFTKGNEMALVDKSKLLYVSLKMNNYGYEQVKEASLSLKDFSKVYPKTGRDAHSESDGIVYVNGEEISPNDENPYLFFENVDGVKKGLVEKAQVYDRGGCYCAYISGDSIEFKFDRNEKLKFIDVIMNDSSFNERLMRCSYYIAWIGDLNRNGQIEFIIETFESDMGRQFNFVEKQSENGQAVMNTIMSYQNQYVSE